MPPTHDCSTSPKLQSPARRSLAIALFVTCAGLPIASARSVCDGISSVHYSALESVTIVDGLSGDPLYVTAPPEDRDRIFIVEQVGRILVHQRGADATDVTTFLDLTGVVSTAGSEQGVLGLAFDPDYVTAGEVYIVDRDGRAPKIVPTFTDLEVSGPGAGDPFLLAQSAWTWHDLAYETGYPVDVHRVYRGLPGETFSCIHATTSTSWNGDPTDPDPGEQFAYLVTPVLPDACETSPGDPSVGVRPRQLSEDPCP